MYTFHYTVIYFKPLTEGKFKNPGTVISQYNAHTAIHSCASISEGLGLVEALLLVIPLQGHFEQPTMVSEGKCLLQDSRLIPLLSPSQKSHFIINNTLPPLSFKFESSLAPSWNLFNTINQPKKHIPLLTAMLVSSYSWPNFLKDPALFLLTKVL